MKKTKKLGAPSKAPTGPSAVRSVRLTDAEWRIYQSLGATDWLRDMLRKAARTMNRKNRAAADTTAPTER